MICEFCKVIVENEYQLYKDETVTVLLDYDPISKGHILIIPNKHYLDLDEMPQKVINHVFKLAKIYVGLLKKAYQPKGYSMMQNGGEFNDVGHFHLHVFPRFSKEEFGWTYAEDVEPAATEFDVLKELFEKDLAFAMKKKKL